MYMYKFSFPSIQLLPLHIIIHQLILPSHSSFYPCAASAFLYIRNQFKTFIHLFFSYNGEEHQRYSLHQTNPVAACHVGVMSFLEWKVQQFEWAGGGVTISIRGEWVHGMIDNVISAVR